MAKSLKVLIAEDHEVVREGLKILIGADPALCITGEAATGSSAVQLARKLQPDVIILDLAMPQGNGLEATHEIRRGAPKARVLVLSAYKDEETVQKMMDAGVAGYLTKHSAADELLTAIREVGAGNSYYSPSISGKLKARLRASFRNGTNARDQGKLTPREQQVLVLVARGRPNKQIAQELSLSVKTVEKHRQATMNKLNIHDIAGLTRYATERGLLDAGGPLGYQSQPVVRDYAH